MKRFQERILIEFNKFTLNYELWRVRIDTEDKLYPTDWKWLEDEHVNKDMLNWRWERNNQK